MQFANQVLLAARSDESNENNDTQRLLRFLAVTVTTAVCLLLYISNSKSRLLNKATAFAKIALLLVIIGFGGNYLHSYGSNDRDWLDTASEHSYEGQHTPSWQSAFITVLFSFHGWENATLVRKRHIWLLTAANFAGCRRGTVFQRP
jgi:amino acid transporter